MEDAYIDLWTACPERTALLEIYQRALRVYADAVHEMRQHCFPAKPEEYQVYLQLLAVVDERRIECQTAHARLREHKDWHRCDGYMWIEGLLQATQNSALPGTAWKKNKAEGRRQ